MFIAAAEIRRAPGRFVLLTVAVGLLVLLLLFFQAVGGALTGGLTGAVAANAADVLVYDDRARRNPLASVVDPQAASAVAGVDGVAAVAPIGVTVVTGQLVGDAAQGGEVDIALFGIDPDGPSLPRRIDDGRPPGDPEEALASGSALQEGFALGDRVTIGERRLAVVGIAPDAAFNVLPTLYVPFDTYTSIVQARVGSAVPVPPSVLGVAVEDDADPVDVAAAIGRSVPGLEALEREAAVAALPGVGQVTRSFAILYLLLYVVVTIVTGVFFLILTVQKRDALVLLRAVGAGRRDLLVPVLLQVLAVTGLGATGGALAAAGLLAAARDTFGAGLEATTAVTTIVAIVLLGLVASTGAVRRVAAIEPIEATAPGRV